MKQDYLFEGAIVLARQCRDEDHGKRRSRCKIIVLGSGFATMQDQYGRKFVTRKSDIRPAKITRKNLEKLGFKEEKTYCPLHRARTSLDEKPYCLQYKYAGPEDISVVLKGGCSLWDHNMTFGRYGMSEISYIHEVQKVINEINNQK